MSDVVIQVGDASISREYFDSIHRTYIEVFSQPPSTWDEEEPERHRERLTRLMGDPSFGVAVALDGEECVGFAYGRRVSVDNPRLVDFVTPVSEDITREWEGRTFIMVDFAVRERVRGQGVGRRLTIALLGSRSEERAILGAEPQALDSHAIYTHMGWRKIGRKRQPGNFVPFVDIFTLPLKGAGTGIAAGADAARDAPETVDAARDSG